MLGWGRAVRAQGRRLAAPSDVTDALNCWLNGRIAQGGSLRYRHEVKSSGEGRLGGVFKTCLILSPLAARFEEQFFP